MKALLKISFAFAVLAMITTGCQQPGGNSTGSEYMPDMGHSVAYEANYYNFYYNNTWGSRDDYYKFAQPKLPVNGTIPRSSTNKHGIAIPTAAGSVPYYYGDSDRERTRAQNEIIKNPLPITDKGLAEGKELYTINCGICHGPKGAGGGYLTRDADPAKGITAGAYPVAAANFMTDTFTLATNGRFYHAIMHGKNLMGGYSDKLSHDERWNVIHYIRSLQAKSKSLTYNQFENTFTSNAADVPAGEMAVAHVKEETPHDNEHGHGHEKGHHYDGHEHSDDGHDEDHHEEGHDNDHGDDHDHDTHNEGDHDHGHEGDHGH
jgi:mono/diheme cytochrome c family protein